MLRILQNGKELAMNADHHIVLSSKQSIEIKNSNNKNLTSKIEGKDLTIYEEGSDIPLVTIEDYVNYMPDIYVSPFNLPFGEAITPLTLSSGISAATLGLGALALGGVGAAIGGGGSGSGSGNSINTAPVAHDDVATVDEDSNDNTITVLTNDTDADGDTLSVTAASALHGTVSINSDGTLNYTPDADYSGEDTITYTLSDGNLTDDTGTVTVTVTGSNDAPIAVDDAITVKEGATFTSSVDLDSNDTDVDGDALSVVAGTLTTTEGGTLVLASDGSYTYTPASGFTGTDTVDYTVTDGNITDIGTLTINVSASGDTAPVAVDDVATVDEDSSDNTITVLTNDTDADGDTLSVTAASALHGTVSINSDGTLNYTPDADYSGEDTITYTLSDGNLTDIGTVTVTVTNINDAPVANDDAIAVTQDTTFTSNVDLDSNDTDVDGDTLSVVAGTFTTTGGGTLVLASDGSYTYTPTSGFTGTDTVDYTLTDGNLTDTGTLSIEVFPPTTVTIDSISEDTGVDATDFITSDNNGLTINATLSGALYGNEVLEYSNDNGTTWIDITSSASGTTVSYTDDTLTSTNTIMMRVIDTAGNAGTEDSQLITIDATPPPTPTIDSYIDNIGPITSDTSTETTTDDSYITLQGTVTDIQAGEVVNVYEDGTLLGTAIVSGNDWTYNVVLTDTSTHTYTVATVDTAGNTTAGTGSLDVALNTMVQLEATGVTNRSDIDPQITALNNGEYVVTYRGEDNDGGDRSIFVQKFNSDGTIQGDQVKLEAIGVTNSNELAPQITAVGENGEYVVTYQGRDSNEDPSIFVQKFSSNGAIQGEQVQLEAPNGIYDAHPQITAVGEDGAYVVTYYGLESTGYYTYIFVQKFNSDGTIQGDQVKLEDRGDGYAPQITAVGENGEYVVTYYGFGSNGYYTYIFVQKFNSDGTIQGDQVQLEASGIYDAHPQITALNNGAYVVTYQGIDSDGDDYSIFVQKFSSNGAIQGDQVKLEAPDVTSGLDAYPQITAVGEDGEYVVTYRGEDSGGDTSIFVQKFDSNGVIQGEQVKLEAIGVTDKNDGAPQITAVGEDGAYVVTYQGQDSDGGDYSIFIQKFSSNGTIQGAQVQLEGAGGGNDYAPQITAVGENGEYVVTFYGVDSNGDDSVFVQKFNSDGTIFIETDNPTITLDTISNDDYINATEAGSDLIITGTTKHIGDNQTVTVTFDGNTYTGTVSSNTFSITIPSTVIGALTDGKTYSVEVSAEDIDGHTTSDTREIIFDTTVPTTTITIDSISEDTGLDATDFITSDNNGLTINASLSAELESGETLMYSLDGTNWIDITSSVNGKEVSYADASLTSSATIHMQVVDAAGNIGAQTTQTVVIDTTPPPTPTIDSYIDNIGPITSNASTETTTDDSYITLQGKVTDIQAGEVVNVYEDGTLLGTAIVSGSDWTYNVVLTDTSTHTYTVATVDTAGNTTAGTGSLDVALNTMVQLEATGVAGEDDKAPQITALNNGEYVVTYYGKDSGGGDYSIFVQKFNNDGTIGGAQVQLEGAGGGNDYDPQITAVGENGEYVVTYRGEDSDGDTSIFVQKFSSNGAIQGDQVKLEAPDVTNKGDYAPQITAVGEDGAYVVTYRGEDNGGDYSIFVQRFDSSGAIQGDQVKLEGAGGGYDYAPQITAVGENGEYVVTYYGKESGGDFSIFVQKFSSNGATQGEQVKLEPTGVTDGDDFIPQITALHDGEYVVTYQGEDSDDHVSIFVQKFKSDGTIQGDQVQLEAPKGIYNDAYPQITAVGENGAYVVTYYGLDSDEDDYSVFVQKFSSNGAIQGDQVQLEATGVTDGNDLSPQITAVGENGEYVVTYIGKDSNGDASIFVQKFNSDGTIQGAQVKLEAIGVTNKDDFAPQITAVGENGEYVVTFHGVDSNGDDSVFVQKFNSDGTIFIETDNPTITLDTISNDDYINAVEAGSDLIITGTTKHIGDDQTVTVTLDGNTYTGTVSSNAFSITIPSTAIGALADGTTYSVEVSTEDIYGNSVNDAREIIFDTTAPTTTITIDGISEDTGVDATDFITSDNNGLTINASLSAELESGETLMYSLDGTNWIDITSLVNGKEVSYVDASLTSSATIHMQVLDVAGNIGAQTTQTVVIDTEAPTATVTIDSYIDNIGSITSDTSTDAITDDSYITLQGTVTDIQAGEVVNVYEDGTLLGTAVVSGSDWTYNVVLTDTSTHTYTVAVADTAGNTYEGTGSLDVALNTMVQLEATGVTDKGDTDPQITALNNGEYVVTYYGEDSEGDTSIFVQKFSSNGAIQGEQVQLEATGVTNKGDYAPQVTAVGTSGEYVVTYIGEDSDGDDYSIFVQKFSSNGAIQGDQVKLEAPDVTSGFDAYPKITALNDGEYVVTYYGQDSDDHLSIFVQKFNSDGTIQGDQVQLEAISSTNSFGRDNLQITAVGENGAYVVTYRGEDSGGDTSIFVQKFDSSGAIQGEQVKLEGVPGSDDANPQITALNDGTYVVTYYGLESNGYNTSIFVQKFSSDGTIGGTQVKLEGAGGGYDYAPQITAVGTSGEYVVTYYGKESDGDDYSIFVQKFSSNGAIQGEQVKLEGVPGGDYANPQITAVGENGEYVVTYYGQDSNGDASVFVQKFSSDGTIQGAQVQLEAIGVTDKDDVAPQITAVGENGEYVVTFFGTDFGTDSNGDFSVFVQKFNSDGTIFTETDNPTITLDTISNDDYINAVEAGSNLVITGTTKHIEDDQTVTVTLDGNTYTGTVSSNAFSITIPSAAIGALTDGTTYSVEVSTEDIYGNSVNDAREIIFDTTPPTTASTIDSYIDDIGPITSDTSTETTTDDSYITLQGTVTDIQAGEVVNVYEDGTLLGTAVVSGNDWTYNVVLTDTSTHTYTVAVANTVGNTTAGTGSLDVTLNTMVQLEATGVTGDEDKNPQITALNNGEYVVTYQGIDSDGDQSIFVQKFNSDGIIQGAQVQLEATDVTNRSDGNPKITAVGTSGEYVVTYHGQDSDGDFSIFVQKFSSNGAIQGEQVKLEAPDVTNGDDLTPQITALNDGEYVVTYQGWDSNGDNSIFVQKFDSSGAIQGEQVQLEAPNSIHDDAHPQITAVGENGEYVVTYEGEDSNGDDSVFVQKFSSNGAIQGEQVKLEGVPGGDDKHPQITALNDGEYVVTYQGVDSDGDDSIFVQKFSSNGAIQGEQVKLEATDVTNKGDYAPQITAVGENGAYVVTYQGVDSDGDDSIFVQKFDSDGAIQGEQVQLEAPNGIYGDAHPQITALHDGAYVVTYTGEDSDGDTSIFIQKFNSDGAIQGEQVQLEATGVTNRSDLAPQVTAVGENGAYVVTFYGKDSNGDNSVFVQKFNSDGTIFIETDGPTSSTIISSYIDNIGSITSDTSMDAITDDSYITLQGTVTNIHAGEVVNVYKDGALLGTAVVSGSDWTYNVVLTDTSTHTYTVAVADTAGNTYEGTGSLDVALNTMVQLEATGVTDKGDTDPQITALNNGEYVVTYYGEDSEGDASIFVQKFSSNGAIQGEQVQLEAIGVTDKNDGAPQITAVGEDGEYVVTFYGEDSDGDDYSIFVQKFSSGGTIQGDQVKLEAPDVTSGFDAYPKITALNDGEYVVTYYGQDSDDHLSIFVQKFNSDGTIQGDQVQLEAISSTNSFGRDNLQITAVGESGEYVVTYRGEDSGGDTSIFVQKFDSSGAIQGEQVKLEGVPGSDDANPQITALNDGTYVVTYYGLESNGYNTSIFVQKFSSDGTIGGTQVKLEGAGGGYDYAPQITAVGENGEYVITYAGKDSDGDDYSIFVQKFSSNGAIQGEQVKLEGVPGGDYANPQITAVGENGEYVVTYYGQDSNGDASVFVQKFSSDGTIQGAQVQLEAIGVTDKDDVAPQITAVGENGEYVVTFFGTDFGTDSNGDFSVFVQKFNSDGTIFTETDNPTITLDTISNDDYINAVEAGSNLVITGTTKHIEDDQTVTVTLNGNTYTGTVSSNAFSITIPSTAIGALTDGTTYSVEVSTEDIYGNSVNDTREIMLDTTPPTTASTIDSYIDDIGPITSDTSTETTTDDSYITLQGTVTDIQAGEVVNVYEDGTLLGTAVVSGSDWTYNVVLTDTSTHTYTVAVADTAGNTTAGTGSLDVTLNTMVQLEATGVTDKGDYKPQITALNDGEYVVTYYGKDSGEDSSIFVQKFSSNGAIQGEQVKLEATGVTDKGDYAPQITALNDGEYVVTYAGEDSNGGNSIFVQKFSSNGAIQGEQIKLEGVPGGNDEHPQITALNNGEYVVTYQGTNSGGDDSVFVQKFDSSGAIQGAQVQLEAPNSIHDDAHPQITAVGTSGEYVVTFCGTDSNGDDSVFVQKFNSDGTIFTETDSSSVGPVALDINGDGIITYEAAFMDINFDDILDTTAWVSGGDGILVWDEYGDGVLHDASQFAFGSNGLTDLEGLAALFDTNSDGIFDSNDTEFGNFGALVDGEIISLADLGITSIDLHSNQEMTHPFEGVTVHGDSTATLVDGTTMLIQDVAFDYEANGGV